MSPHHWPRFLSTCWIFTLCVVWNKSTSFVKHIKRRLFATTNREWKFQEDCDICTDTSGKEGLPETIRPGLIPVMCQMWSYHPEKPYKSMVSPQFFQSTLQTHLGSVSSWAQSDLGETWSCWIGITWFNEIHRSVYMTSNRHEFTLYRHILYFKQSLFVTRHVRVDLWLYFQETLSMRTTRSW